MKFGACTKACVVMLVLAASLARAAGAGTGLVDFAAPGVDARVKPNGTEGVRYKLVDVGGGGRRALEVTCLTGKNDYPGVSIAPDGAAWDLSKFGAVEADVTNLSAEPLDLVLRVDNDGDWKAEPWNGDRANIEPGRAGTVKVYFGYSWGNRGYALDPAKVVRLLLFTGRRQTEATFRVDAIRATGAPGGKPPGIVDRVKPVDGVMVKFDGAFDPSRMESRGAATAAVSGDGDGDGDGGARAARVTVPAGRDDGTPAPGACFRSPGGGVGWDLSDWTRVEFALRNPGDRPVRVVCRVDNANATDRSNSASAEATIAPGARAVVAVPFAARRPWDPDDKAAGSPVVSDAVVGASVSVSVPRGDGAAQRIDVEEVRAAAGPPAALPAWVGHRPPVEGNWTPTLDENFDGDALDPKLWVLPRRGEASIWDSVSVHSPDEAVVRGGCLALRCEKPAGGLHFDDPGLKGRTYLTTVVTSKGKWTQRYGYFEARMKLPRALGMWPAFWMMPDRGPAAGDEWAREDTHNGGMEFDIMEHLVRFGPHRYNIAMHWDGYQKEHKSIGTETVYFEPDREGFVTSGMLWEPGRLTFYCNGAPVGTWKNDRIANVPGHILFTMPVGGWGTYGMVDDAKLPDEFKIDYVRAWQKAEWMKQGSGVKPEAP